MISTLQMIFQNEEGRNVTVSVPEARDDLQAAEVETVMTNILARDIIISPGGALTDAVKAQVVSRQVETLVEF